MVGCRLPRRIGARCGSACKTVVSGMIEVYFRRAFCALGNTGLKSSNEIMMNRCRRLDGWWWGGGGFGRRLSTGSADQQISSSSSPWASLSREPAGSLCSEGGDRFLDRLLRLLRALCPLGGYRQIRVNGVRSESIFRDGEVVRVELDPEEAPACFQ